MKNALIAVTCAVLLVSGCGSGGNELASVPGTGTTSSEAAAPSDPVASAPVSATPSAPVGGSASAPVGGSASAPAGAGSTFTDPGGTYTISVGRTWRDATTAAGQGRAWIVGRSVGGTTPILSVVTQNLPASAQGMDPAQFITLNVTNLKASGFTIVKTNVIQGTSTPSLGAIEYTGKAGKSPVTLHFLAVFDMNQTTVALATLATAPSSYLKTRSTILPYMRTLKVT